MLDYVKRFQLSKSREIDFVNEETGFIMRRDRLDTSERNERISK